MSYTRTQGGVKLTATGAYIPIAIGNRDFRIFLAWLLTNAVNAATAEDQASIDELGSGEPLPAPQPFPEI